MNIVTFSALSDPNRFHIVELLREKARPVGELSDTLHLRQPQVSKHLKVLSKAGIVKVRPLANKHYYKLSPLKFKELDSWLERYRGMWESRLDRLDEFLKNEKKALRRSSRKK